jgi:hypothetical protein
VPAGVSVDFSSEGALAVNGPGGRGEHQHISDNDRRCLDQHGSLIHQDSIGSVLRPERLLGAARVAPSGPPLQRSTRPGGRVVELPASWFVVAMMI